MKEVVLNLRPLLLAQAALLLVACSAEPPVADEAMVESSVSPPRLVEEAVTADKSFSDAVVVKADSLVIPTAGHEAMLDQIRVGSVLAGDRARRGRNNPYGFLRHVLGITRSGKDTVISTSKAELGDWLQEGRIDFSSTRSLLDPDSGSSLKLRDKREEGTSEKTEQAPLDATIDSAITISHAHLEVKSHFDGYFEAHRKNVKFFPDPITGVKFKSVLTLDPTFTADINVSVSDTAHHEGTVPGGGFETVLPAPFPITLKVSTALHCTLDASATLGFTIGATIGAHVVAGFEGELGLQDARRDNLSSAPTLNGGIALENITGEAKVTGRCELIATIDLLAFDSVGLQGTIGPYVSVTTDVCLNATTAGTSSGINVSEEHGLMGSLGGRLQVPVLDKGDTFELTSCELPADGGVHYLLGGPDTCTRDPQLDSCAGRADGFYCSQLVAGSGITCVNQTITGGLPCGGDLECVGGTPGKIECQ